MDALKEWLLKKTQVYQEEGSYLQHDGKRYALNPILARADELPVVAKRMGELDWILPFGTPDEERVLKANIEVPLLIIRWNHKWVVIDGYHRLTKLSRQRHLVARVKIVPNNWLKEA